MDHGISIENIKDDSEQKMMLGVEKDKLELSSLSIVSLHEEPEDSLSHECQRTTHVTTNNILGFTTPNRTLCR